MKPLAAAVRRVRGLRPPAWTSAPRVGLALIVASCVVTLAVAALGPSCVTLDVGPASGPLPPWFVPEDARRALGLPLSEWVLVPALWAGIAAGGAGLWVALRGLAAGWRPGVHRLFALGAGLNAATVLVPPLTSADVLMYAAYGRLQRLGRDPYTITPAEVFRSTFDPVLVHTERPWQDTPSVYGPIASWTQWLANVLGGGSMHGVVFWLQVLCVVPFVVIGALLVKLAHGDEVRQRRAVLLTVANPLLIWAVIAGAHNEALTLVFAICALFFVRRSAFVTGLFIGLAGAVKVSLVFYGLALVWGYRRDWRKLVALGAGALVPLALGYGLLAPEALFAASRNTGYISQGSWGPPVVYALGFVMPDPTARSIVTRLGWVLMVVVAWMLSRVVGWELVPGAGAGARGGGGRTGAGARPGEGAGVGAGEGGGAGARAGGPDGAADPLTVATRTALVLCAAWVISSPYSLAWYDLIAWAPLALLAPNRLDKILIVRGAALSIAYVTARSVEFGPGMQWASWLVRETLCSGVQFGVLAAVVWWWWRAGHELPTRRFVVGGWRSLVRPLSRAGGAGA